MSHRYQLYESGKLIHRKCNWSICSICVVNTSFDNHVNKSSILVCGFSSPIVLNSILIAIQSGSIWFIVNKKKWIHSSLPRKHWWNHVKSIGGFDANQIIQKQSVFSPFSLSHPPPYKIYDNLIRFHSLPSDEKKSKFSRK